MLKWILFISVCIQSFALEISVDSAKDDFTKYSTLHLINDTPFSCQAIKNNFDVTTKVLCAFSKKPLKNIKPFQNDFFRVQSLQKEDTFFIVITPIYNMKLFSNIFDLTKDDVVFSKRASSAKRWFIVGYNKKFPLIKPQGEIPEIALDLPFFLDKDKMPYVGSLDLQGNPVHIKKVEDVKDYLKVKKEFQNKNYEASLETIQDILDAYPHTLFKEELLYYKIKAEAMLENWEDVIDDAKIFLREYSASDDVAEVLSLIARGYAKLSQPTDADYFFDRLFSEHPKSIYAQWGYIYKGDMYVDEGGSKAAKKYYIKALRHTQNIEVAATAAFRLANVLLDSSTQKAAKYVMKIVQAKPKFFAENFKASLDMMKTFADSGDYKTAAAMAGAILKGINATYDEYEKILKERAVWLAKTSDKKAALAAINDYIKKFPDGDYIDEIDNLKNELFFDVSDLNATAKLQEYDKLMEEYKGKTIGQRALYEKAKLLLKEKEYDKVLAMQEELNQLDDSTYKDIPQLIEAAAKGSMEVALEKRNCIGVLHIAQDYNITLSDKWDDGVYSCAMKGGDFSLSKTIALKNLKVKSVAARKKWLYRYIKVEFATGNYTDVIEAANDLITLIGENKNSPYLDVYRTLFDTYERVENKKGMLDTILKIEKLFGVSYKDIDRYVAMISVGNDMHDDTLIIKYGTKVMQMQKKFHSYVQSPFVEFALYDAYMDQEEYNKAYEVIKSLDKRNLNAKQRARQKYLLGNVLSRLWRDEEAKEAYKASIKADKNSSWAKLSQSALQI